MLTEKHFKYFTKCASFYQRKLGLSDWSVAYHFETEEELKDEDCNNTTYLAYTNWNSKSRAASITLSSDWKGVKVTGTLIRTVAYHEMLELLMVEIYELLDPTYSDAVSCSAVHKIIRALENAKFGPNTREAFMPEEKVLDKNAAEEPEKDNEFYLANPDIFIEDTNKAIQSIMAAVEDKSAMSVEEANILRAQAEFDKQTGGGI